MIVDDHADMRRVLRNVVQLSFTAPVEFMECDSGEIAIAQYAGFSPNLVLMDVELKSMSGFEVTEELMNQDEGAKVVIVTSYDTPSFRRKAKKLQTKGFICKDRLTDLHQLLHNIIH